ncbi:MAG: hypothetical protein MUC95_02595 [Spirochaetes bacterium]|nr:hypothetical protein [Spirochaetota bacterium]
MSLNPMKITFKYLNRMPVITALFLIISAGIIIIEKPAAGKSGERDGKTEEELYFTYAGATLGGGIDWIQYRDWISDSEGQEIKKVSGPYFCGGALIDIFVNSLIGEFSIQYISNINSKVPVGHMIYDAAGKYAYQVYDFLSVTGGAGLFIETQPATKNYNNGAGVSASIGAVYNIDRDWRLIFDIVGRYGSFGLGEESTRQSYGAKIGIVYKVGRI